MSQERLPSPEPAICLVRPYSSSQKGGTVIAEDVMDRATHELRLRTPGGYRPPWCGKCGHGMLHVHDYPERRLLAEPLDAERPATVVRIVRHLCVACGATWRTLPAFLARHLWRSWPVVEAVTVSAPPPWTQPFVPERTRRRWAARLASKAAQLVQILATSAEAVLDTVASVVGLVASRSELVDTHAQRTAAPRGQKLSSLAALIHRMVPGVRLM